jgi:hypothetical protein
VEANSVEPSTVKAAAVETATAMEAASAAMTSTCEGAGGSSQPNRGQCHDGHYRFAYHCFILSCASSPQPQRPRRDRIISDTAKV